MNYSAETPKQTVINEIELFLNNEGFRIIEKDDQRPWGGYFKIDEEQIHEFLAAFFPGLRQDDLFGFARLSPKILLVAPGKRLSWQYHLRRSELWRVIGGEVGVVISDTDEEDEKRTLHVGDEIELRQGERHRLTGLETWGVVAEIWKHIDKAHPSDEGDIVRLQDDFGR
ncbi:MAG: phosphoheptose isomerase [Balneolaceae bacterium]